MDQTQGATAEAAEPKAQPSTIWLTLLLLIIGGCIGVVVGLSLEMRTLAMMLGLAVGVIASVPSTVLLVAVIRRMGRAEPVQESALVLPPEPVGMPVQPTMYVLNLNDLVRQQMMAPQAPQYLPQSSADAVGRRVVGVEEWNE